MGDDSQPEGTPAFKRLAPDALQSVYARLDDAILAGKASDPGTLLLLARSSMTR